jgi:1-acyl-sn-glycerol-3-phosphate acyltransferase
MNKSREKEIRFEPRRPSAFLYWLLVPFAALLARVVFRRTIIKDKAVKKIKGPYVAIGTHACAMDVGFMMTALMPRRLNIVCGRDVFTWKPIKPIIEAAGLLPISQFAMDVSSIRLMKKAVDKGLSLSLFPEGKISLDGRPLHYLSPSLAKLLKFLNAPVVMCHSKGGYSSRPKWFRLWKRGKIEMTVKLLFTVEELSKLSNEEVYARLKEAYDYNDHAYQRENNIRFESKTPAKGLHYILYKCPKCGAEYEMSSTDRELICSSCGNTVEYTERGELIPKGDGVAIDRIDKWYDFERESVRKEIADPNFRVSHPVVWEKNNPINNIYGENGEGELYVDSDFIGFDGRDLNGEPVSIKIPLRNLYTIVQKTKEAVDLTVDGVVNRFYFREGKYSVKYTLYVEESFRKIHQL